MDRWMGGWMDGWVDRWMDEWMGVWSDEWMLFSCCLNPLPHMPSFGSSNSAANKDMVSKILTNGDTIF